MSEVIAIKTLNGHPLADTEARKAIETLKESASGGSLPTGGEAYQMLVTNHKGEAEWQPRPYYETVNLESFMQYYVEPADEGMYSLTLANNPGMVGVQYVAGETYKVELNPIGLAPIVYETSKCYLYDGAFYIGNMSFLGAETGEEFEDTGENYIFMCSPEITVLLYTGEEVIAFVNIYGATSHPIHLPAKYAPCVVSPSGTKYKIVVSDDGTLSAEQIEIETIYP